MHQYHRLGGHFHDLQLRTTYTYDGRGNRLTIQDPVNGSTKLTTFTYDPMNRIQTITYPGSTTSVQFHYDYRGRRDYVIDQNTNKTSYGYDDADRLISVTDAQSPTPGVTRYAYDTENNLTDIWDAASNHTQFSSYFGPYPMTATFPSGYAENYSYDSNGNLTTKTDRNRNATTYTFDYQNRMVRKIRQDSSAVIYTRDAAGRLQQVQEVASPTPGTYTFAYDNMGRLTSATSNYQFTSLGNEVVQYTYDAASNRKTLTDPQNLVPTAYAYDKLNRLASITLNNDPSPDFTFAYDALSRRTSLTRPNSITTTYGYTTQSWVNSILHKNSAGTVLDGATYTYDNAGNRKTRVDKRLGTTLTFGYDNIYQLLSAKQGSTTKESYTYDLVGNRLSSLGVSPYTYNSSNELMSLPSGSFTYDNNGNTKTKPDGTQYGWDFDNQLTQAVLPGSGGTVNFKYDPFGRRIQKAFTQGSTTTTTNYIYDGPNTLEEIDQNGNVLARYTQALSVDEPLAQFRSGTTSYYQADGLASITSLSNTTGTLSNTYTYDSYAKLTSSAGSVINSLQYAGREFDSETANYYNRSRYYDQNVGRFLNEDRIKFNGGTNFYAYVGNEPTLYTDPLGLRKCRQISPWTEIPSMGSPELPFRVEPAGMYWQRVGWGFATSLRCYCDWQANRSRVKAYYHYTKVERAKFECEPCKQAEYQTRKVTEEFWRYEEGNPLMPTQTARTWGTPYRTDEFADDSPSTDTSGCTCKAPLD